MKMDAGLDTGDVISTATTPIRPEDNFQSLHDRLAELGAELLVSTLPDYLAGRITPVPQPEGEHFYARKICKEDGHLDWTQPVRALSCRIRALTPWPERSLTCPRAIRKSSSKSGSRSSLPNSASASGNDSQG
jgi:methionyl-tRNA formyltransferase